MTTLPTKLGAHGPQVFPCKQLDDALLGLDVTFTSADVAQIEVAVPAGLIAGTRYPAALMGTLDSER